ncbi:MAG: hypothetical protein J0M01_02530 [Dechloromonas sp.]|nr:hypothetical protein [Dechloromonas sp.]MBN8555361.1 hypothetical protein [Deltaproteobacteria bacterium]
MKFNINISLPYPFGPEKNSEAKGSASKVAQRYPEYVDDSVAEEPLENETAAIKIKPRSEFESLSYEVRQQNERPGVEAPISLSAQVQSSKQNLEKFLNDLKKTPELFKAAHSSVRRSYATQLLMSEG